LLETLPPASQNAMNRVSTYYLRRWTYDSFTDKSIISPKLFRP
jgi:hypothetical protein